MQRGSLSHAGRARVRASDSSAVATRSASWRWPSRVSYPGSARARGPPRVRRTSSRGRGGPCRRRSRCPPAGRCPAWGRSRVRPRSRSRRCRRAVVRCPGSRKDRGSSSRQASGPTGLSVPAVCAIGRFPGCLLRGVAAFHRRRRRRSAPVRTPASKARRGRRRGWSPPTSLERGVWSSVGGRVRPARDRRRDGAHDFHAPLDLMALPRSLTPRSRVVSVTDWSLLR